MFKSKPWIYLIGVVLMTSIAVATTTTSTNTIYADSDNGKDKDPNTETETELEGGESETENVETEDTTEGSTESDEETQGSPGNGDRQPGRVGSHDDGEQTSSEGANAGGTITDPTITGDPDSVDEGDTVSANCFGRVISHEAQEHKENPDEGTLGEHSSDPVPQLEGNETPRQGIGNQDQGHPSAHGAFNSQFEEEDAENVEENC